MKKQKTMQVATPGINDPQTTQLCFILQYVQNHEVKSILSSDMVDINFFVVFTVRISKVSRQKRTLSAKGDRRRQKKPLSPEWQRCSVHRLHSIELKH